MNQQDRVVEQIINTIETEPDIRKRVFEQQYEEGVFIGLGRISGPRSDV